MADGGMLGQLQGHGAYGARRITAFHTADASIEVAAALVRDGALRRVPFAVVSPRLHALEGSCGNVVYAAMEAVPRGCAIVYFDSGVSHETRHVLARCKAENFAIVHLCSCVSGRACNTALGLPRVLSR